MCCSDFVLEVWAYEALRLFKDRMVGVDSINRFDNILQSVVRADWSSNVFDSLRGTSTFRHDTIRGILCLILFNMLGINIFF